LGNDVSNIKRENSHGDCAIESCCGSAINESVQDAKNAAGDCCISGDLEGWVNFGKKVGEREAVAASECLLSHFFPLLRQVFCRPFRDVDGSSSLSSLEIMTWLSFN
jgi:hypothetical protein